MPFSNERGFTLVEILVAVVVFAFGMLALCRLQAASVVSNATSQELTQANVLAQGRMETIMSWLYDNPGNGLPWLDDVTGDGTGKDLDEDADDDSNNKGIVPFIFKSADYGFGINNTTADLTGITPPSAVTADGCITINAKTNAVSDCSAALNRSVDFRIFHNIVVGQPIPTTKTFRVIVVWLDGKGAPHSTSLTSTKAVAY